MLLLSHYQNQGNWMRRLPAEWEKQDGVLMAWPHALTDWEPLLDGVIPVYLEIIKAIIPYEKVVLVGPDKKAIEETLSRHGLSSNIIISEIPNNDTWARDFGPIGVYERARTLMLDFGFNGWGLKFPSNHDNQISKQLFNAGILKDSLLTPGLILEGGSIESDGEGTLLTTSECLLNPNRNPHLSQEQIEEQLKNWLGVRKVLWLDHGYLAGDDTDSHIDTLARLCPDQQILYVTCPDERDEHYVALKAMEAQLRTFTDHKGRPFKLVGLPWPSACFAEDGERLPATYANFLILNEAVLVPTYGVPEDEAALKIFEGAFPARKIIGIGCRVLIEQHGSLHCITMQLPQGALA